MIYLDSSALLKLLHEEPESAGLEEWISDRAQLPMISSELAQVEVLRACRRIDPDALPAARTLLTGLDLVPLTGVLSKAAEVGDVALRSLDAIHLASALCLGGGLSAFVVYDRRLYDAAAAAGLEPLSPGT